MLFLKRQYSDNANSFFDMHALVPITLDLYSLFPITDVATRNPNQYKKLLTVHMTDCGQAVGQLFINRRGYETCCIV